MLPMENQNSMPVVAEKVFLLDPANSDFVAGKKRRLAPWRFAQGCMLVFLIPFLLIGIGLLGWGIQRRAEWQQISSSGVMVRGQVMDRSISRDADGDIFHVTYGYDHNGRLFTRSENVSADIYGRAEPGTWVDVVYVPATPTLARLAETNEASQISFVFIFSLCWNGLAWPMFLGGIAGAVGNRTLERKSRVISGEVVSCEGYTDGDGDYTLRVQYRFQPPDEGQAIIKKISSTRNDLRNQLLPEPGTPLAIAYCSRRLYRVL
jgi:hypothetical protein